jgi:phenylpropionate dioxygenase-like ring-hydroxylating dioxygenase large terminal subunit
MATNANGFLNQHTHFSFIDPSISDAPPWDTGPVSSEPFRSQEVFEAERDKIFKKVWLNVARDWEIPNPGDYVVKNIEILNASIILVRGDDGGIRSFHNTCCHRGNKLIDPYKHPDSGTRRTFRCVFHGWTYNLEGKLIQVPDEKHFYDFDKADCNLMPVHTGEWRGHIFINIDEHPEHTLDEWLGEMGRRVGPYPFEDFKLASKWTATVECNYKVFMDAFQETYHVAFIHKKSFPGEKDPNDPHMNSPFMHFFGPHRNLAVPGPGSPQTAVRTGETFQDKSVKTGLNLDGVDKWGFDLDVIFPNYFLNMFDDQYFTHNFWPVGVDQTYWECHLYSRKANNASHLFALEKEKVLLRDAIQEDLSTNEATQASLNTGAMKNLYFSAQEAACRHQYYVMDKMINGEENT